MDFLWFLIIGLVAGWLAGQVTKGSSFGLGGDLVIGVVGALLGGWLFNLLGLSIGGLLGPLFTAFIGAVVFLWLMRLVRK